MKKMIFFLYLALLLILTPLGIFSHGPAKKLAEFVCSIVVAVTSYTQEISVATGFRCRRRPKRKPCKGEVYAFLNDEQGIIEWHCFIYGDRGHITDWENTHANHTSDKDLEDALDVLYESLENLLDSTKQKML